MYVYMRDARSYPRRQGPGRKAGGRLTLEPGVGSCLPSGPEAGSSRVPPGPPQADLADWRRRRLWLRDGKEGRAQCVLQLLLTARKSTNLPEASRSEVRDLPQDRRESWNGKVPGCSDVTFVASVLEHHSWRVF